MRRAASRSCGAPDVKALEATGLKTTPEGQPAALLYKLADALFLRSPWRIQVEQEGSDRLTVSIHRGRHPVGTQVIDRAALRLDDLTLEDPGADKPQEVLADLHVMAAAYILMTLAQYYKLVGLYGATSWRSVGYHALATSEPLKGTPLEEKLLLLAVDDDPHHLAAQVALRQTWWRKTASSEDLLKYADWVTRQLPLVAKATSRDRHGRSSTDDGRLMRLRLLRIRAVALGNRCFGRGVECTEGDRNDFRDAAAAFWHELVAKAPRSLPVGDLPVRTCPADVLLPADATDLEKRMLLSGAALYLTFRQPSGDSAAYRAAEFALKGRASAPETFRNQYNLACYYATLEAPQDEQTAELLTVASRDSEIKEWMTQDPMLAAYWQRRPEGPAAYRPDRVADVWRLAPFGPYREVLLGARILTPLQLLTTDDRVLEYLLSAGPGRVESLRSAAGLALRLHETRPTWGLELYRELSARGYQRWPVELRPGESTTIADAMTMTTKDVRTAKEIDDILRITITDPDLLII